MKRLKRLRESRKLTQEKLGEMLNVQKAAVSKYETGLVVPSPEVLKKLSAIFGLPAEYLMVRDDGLPSLPKPRTGENNSFFGKHHTEETLAVLSRKNSGENSPNFGKHLTAEIRAKIGAGNRGKKRSTEARVKVSVKKRTESPFKNLAEMITNRRLSYKELANLMGVVPSIVSRKMTKRGKQLS